MARPLTTASPTSSVARLLEPGIGRAALSEPPREFVQQAPEPQQTGETPDIKREFILTQTADDTLGHLTGDIVLRNVAREGIQIMQPHHVPVYRYGGEEFAVLFQAGQIADAFSLLEAWRTAVEKRVWREENLRVTFSGGLGEWHFEPLEQFVESVDNALYSAKRQGKNRILRTSVG